MDFPVTSYSWEIVSDTIAIKSMDKSTFLHHGSGIPQEIAFFFNLPETGILEPKSISIIENGNQYSAHIQMDSNLGRYRLFWKSPFSALIKARFPEIWNELEEVGITEQPFPKMQLQRINSDEYRVRFIESPAQPHDWTDDELSAAIVAYFDMLEKESHGERYNKAQMNRELRNSTLSARSKGSVEFRMQNISAVLQGLCHPIVNGYLPRGNVGADVSNRIKRIIFQMNLLNENDFSATADQVELDLKVSGLLKKKLSGKPAGQINPVKREGTNYSYERDPLVKAWILQNARGICEFCNERGPFKDKNEEWFLEVHHVQPLADGGMDTISNAVALCPNCHKRCHFAADRDAVKARLYELIDRLNRIQANAIEVVQGA